MLVAEEEAGGRDRREGREKTPEDVHSEGQQKLRGLPQLLEKPESRTRRWRLRSGDTHAQRPLTNQPAADHNADQAERQGPAPSDACCTRPRAVLQRRPRQALSSGQGTAPRPGPPRDLPLGRGGRRRPMRATLTPRSLAGAPPASQRAADKLEK